MNVLNSLEKMKQKLYKFVRLILGISFVLTLILYVFLRLDIGYRILGSTRITQHQKS